jgi:hypothetical protein
MCRCGVAVIPTTRKTFSLPSTAAIWWEKGRVPRFTSPCVLGKSRDSPIFLPSSSCTREWMCVLSGLATPRLGKSRDSPVFLGLSHFLAK